MNRILIRAPIYWGQWLWARRDLDLLITSHKFRVFILVREVGAEKLILISIMTDPHSGRGEGISGPGPYIPKHGWSNWHASSGCESGKWQICIPQVLIRRIPRHSLRTHRTAILQKLHIQGNNWLRFWKRCSRVPELRFPHAKASPRPVQYRHRTGPDTPGAEHGFLLSELLHWCCFRLEVGAQQLSTISKLPRSALEALFSHCYP